jgi:hypothetical protein
MFQVVVAVVVGANVFVPLFRRHVALIKRAFEGVSPEELHELERILKKVGKRAEGLAEKPARLSLKEPPS